MPPAVRPMTRRVSFGWRRTSQTVRVFSSPLALNEGVSSSPRRSQSTLSASTAPMKKGMRQAQASRSAEGSSDCRTMSTASAMSWPAIRVTYWNDDQKPRRFRPAISER